ncbi:dienelactone hydrolase endo-1-3,1,4-beta-D-glucanase [Guyanagaster necrorhizus]|uniref:Dienelactone hydrolase endo-1-3,1,4-beta-D-glucanase n=1 Tax=Guyanagaster necrorhizus TaxID=856835 RepID=A0A9P7VM01_9AGAR|nr:dienelactone hydrolase endo-1-3,1,4-beta-D-glucanase [Guyanagaster necrorhizus MCA 3950]KAG7443072.1 dienelactone hydrolase endo-1-3,1,4-beta-D-glucanase [Guyanagaster necrorhizus MCA 3950]
MSCPNCFKGEILAGEPTGTISIQGAYYAQSSEPSTRAVLLLTDIFGLRLKNSKILADFFAEQLKCDVWVPDLFDGKPPVEVHEMKIPERVGEKIGFFGYLTFFWIFLKRFPLVIRSRPSVVDQRVTTFINALKAEKKYEKLGAVGYCFGGAVAVRIGATNLFDTIVVCHPGGLSTEQFKALKVPSSWACAEEDMGFKPAARAAAEAELAGRKGKPNFVEYEFIDHKGTTHGFAARPNLAYPEVKAGFEAALQQTVEWFKKTLLA